MSNTTINPQTTLDGTCLGILIPAYCPTQHFPKLVHELIDTGFTRIVVVNDGSGPEYQPLFQAIAKEPAVRLIEHHQNQGKGAALKTGFHFFLNHFNDTQGVITVDADGQHHINDIFKIAHALAENSEQCVLGVRSFNSNVPFRSQFGNQISKRLFKLYYGRQIQDTQTGLRGIPRSLLHQLAEIPYSKYEYEMQSLIDMIESEHPIKQVSIQTIYEDNNDSSHFNPLIDSVRIYFVFFRYLIVALSSFLIDWGLFAALYHTTYTLLPSLIIARLVSASFNFYQNKYKVYHAHDTQRVKTEALQYALLALTTLCIAYVAIHTLQSTTFMPVLLIKIGLDLVLFMMNFLVQRFFIFQKG